MGSFDAFELGKDQLIDHAEKQTDLYLEDSGHSTTQKHTHAVHTAALSMPEVSHMDDCVLYDDVAFVAKWPGVLPAGSEEGDLISGALGDKGALMLSYHGLLIAAPTIEEACVKALAFERAAKMQ